MINLLPPTAKKSLAPEYRLRLLSVLMLAVSAVSLVALVLSIPTYMLLERQTETFVNSGDLTREIGLKREEIMSELEKTRALIDYLSQEVETKPYVDIISNLDSLSGSEVVISQFTFDNRDTLVISGTASTRASLSDFQAALDARPEFKKVELPLSDLVQDISLPFSITITLD